MPPDFSQTIVGQPLCVSGTVAPQADFGGVALLGINVNQAMQAMSEPMTAVPTADGITVTVMKVVDSPLRVQLQGPNGSTDANDRWCATLTGSGGFVRFGSFNTKCWDGSGKAYANQPIVSVSVVVPGSNMAAVPFNFCLTGFHEGAGP
jgi:hypothetical protein